MKKADVQKEMSQLNQNDALDVSAAISVALHIAVCPNASNVPDCANAHHCNLSCVSLYVAHLEKCTRCVEHLFGDDGDGVGGGGGGGGAEGGRRGNDFANCESACANVHCRKVANCWRLKGDVIDCCYRNKLKIDGYGFQNVVKQLEVVLQLDFQNLTFCAQSEQGDAKDSREQRERAAVVKKTEILFDFLQLFITFKQKMASCGMKLDGTDLVGLLHSLTHQLVEQK